MRTKLTITSPIETKQTSKGKPFYTFKAKDGDKEFNYSTFSQTIGTTLVQGIQCEAEVEEKEHTGNDGTVYKNRTVNQVWIDGKPVREEKKSYQGNFKSDSPEKIASIERMKCLDCATNYAIAAKMDSPGLLKVADKMLAWIQSKQLEQKPTETTEHTNPESGPADSFDKIPSASGEIPMKTLGDFFSACHKQWGMTKSQVLKELGISDQKQIGHLPTAYLQIKAIKEPK